MTYFHFAEDVEHVFGQQLIPSLHYKTVEPVYNGFFVYYTKISSL